ncbi:hypothetical protein ACKWTF_015652 [Chironomus riparius]
MADIVLNCSFEKLGIYTGVSHILLSIGWFTFELIRLFGDSIVRYDIIFMTIAVLWFFISSIFVIGIKRHNHRWVSVFVLMSLIMEIVIISYFAAHIAMQLDGETNKEFCNLAVPLGLLGYFTYTCLVSFGVYIKMYRIAGGYERL